MFIRAIVMGMVGVVAVMATAADTRPDTRVDTRPDGREELRQYPRFRQGDRTFTISGSGSSDHDFDANIAALEVELGWFLVDDLAVELRQEVGFGDVRGEDDWSGSTRLGLDYFLNFVWCKPFVGANIGFLYGDTVKEQFVAGPNVGVRCFVNQTTFINLGMEYQFLFEDTRDAKDTYDDGRFVYGVGMGVKW